MIRIDKRVGPMKVADLYLSDCPFDLSDCSAVTFYWCPNLVDAEGFEREEAPTAVIDLTKDLEAIWKAIDHTGRRNINQAEREGVKVRISKDFDEFWRINLDFIKTKGYGYRFGIGLPPIEELKRKGTLLIAEQDGQMLVGHIHLEDGHRMVGLVAASKRLEGQLEISKLVGKANRLVYWEKMKRGKEIGLTEYDMGGMVPSALAEANPALMSLNTFKLSLGADSVVRYNYRRRYSRLYDLAYKTMRRWKGRDH